MPFVTKDFPDRVFQSVSEYIEAKLQIASPQPASKMEVRLKAELIPAPAGTIERKVVDLEKRVTQLEKDKLAKTNKEGLLVGTILYGTSKGSRYTLEVLEKEYLCSDGNLYPTLSAAALGVSGNRRSGWKFWETEQGKTIGQHMGRLDPEGHYVGFNWQSQG